MNPDPATLNALELAVEAEKTSLGDYLQFAWQTRDPGGKNMFLRLAMDELHHMRLLEQQRDGLCRSGTCEPVTIEPSLIEKVIPHLDDTNLRIQGGAGQDQLAALRAALEAENSARAFYTAQAESAGPGSARDMFARLAEMEQAHAELVRAELDSIQHTGFWFGMQEFSLESE